MLTHKKKNYLLQRFLTTIPQKYTLSISLPFKATLTEMCVRSQKIQTNKIYL